MSKISGMKVKLFIKDATTGKLLAGQRNATLNRSAESIDATSKDTAGFWKESVAGFKEWSIEADGAFVESDVAYGLLETAFLNSENVDIYLELPSGTKYEGNATITDFSNEFPFDDLVTYSISFQGSGALTTVPAA
ncbi:phage major tail protein, TP901-1 family [Priestia megaterium]|uniref:phage major tail protein, TP901-1 family n=1 Tax=Priestia megaterium TaxID=1404 RepID=UPI0021C0DAF9|nr:phage major tail protein, TP901-1 family [Priestia megaterium]MCT9858221.1 phage major tail protein, TP901-1 family [Priestia megaterium]MDF1958487.1 phage major tail protein, TP901-1 family [Priestia megaterium]